MKEIIYSGIHIDINANDPAVQIQQPLNRRQQKECPAPHPPAPQNPTELVGMPNRNESRGKWAKYVESIGIDAGDKTRAELIEIATNRGECND